MITTKQDLKDYIKADRERSGNKRFGLLHRLFYSEQYFLQRYLLTLRKLEYLSNKKRNILENFRYLFVFWRYKRMTFRQQINIPINVAGQGLIIHHIGVIIINSKARLGNNCSLQPGVIIGKKDNPDTVPTIGDNVYFGPGVKIIGKITIGNNVVIAPNSVVISDIPDNCVISGVPATIIRQNGQALKR